MILSNSVQELWHEWGGGRFIHGGCLICGPWKGERVLRVIFKKIELGVW